MITYHQLLELMEYWNNPNELIIRLKDFTQLQKLFKPSTAHLYKKDKKGIYIQFNQTKIRPRSHVFVSIDLSHAPLADQVD